MATDIKRDASTMTKLEALTSRFYTRFGVSDTDSESLTAHAAALFDNLGDETPSIVGVTSAVSTFIAEKSFGNFAIPHFAAHWGVVCDFLPRVRTLFHLQYDPSTKKTSFAYMNWQPQWSKHSMTQVGTTKFSMPQVIAIG